MDEEVRGIFQCRSESDLAKESLQQMKVVFTCMCVRARARAYNVLFSSSSPRILAQCVYIFVATAVTATATAAADREGGVSTVYGGGERCGSGRPSRLAAASLILRCRQSDPSDRAVMPARKHTSSSSGPIPTLQFA